MHQNRTLYLFPQQSETLQPLTPHQQVLQPPAAFQQSPAPVAPQQTVRYESIQPLMTEQPRAPTAHHPQIQPLMTPIQSTAPQQAQPQQHDPLLVTRSQIREQSCRSCRILEASDLPSDPSSTQQADPQEGSRQEKLKLLMQQQALRAQSSSTGAIPKTRKTPTASSRPEKRMATSSAEDQPGSSKAPTSSAPIPVTSLTPTTSSAPPPPPLPVTLR